MSAPEEFDHEKAWQAQLSREAVDAAVASYVVLPEAADDESIFDTYQRLLEVEQSLFPNGDYLNGSARTDDDYLTLHGLSRVLLTAEHASMQQRATNKGILKPKEADMGTGALAHVVAQDTNSTAIIARGRQQGDPNYDPGHAFKVKGMAPIIMNTANRAHLSFHMLNRGRASYPTDERGYSIMLGISNNASGATKALVDKVKAAGEKLGHRVGINQAHINFDKDHKLRLNDDGTLKTVTFAGAGPNTTRTFSQTLAEQLGKGDAYAAMQIEINEVLLALQNDDVSFPSERDRAVGAYTTYLLTKYAAASVAEL
jgi:hypothetical protein